MKAHSITNVYGNVDLAHGKMTKGYDHIPGDRRELQNICAKLNVAYAPAVVSFNRTRWGSSPEFNGVVVTKASCEKVRRVLNDGYTAEENAAHKKRLAQRRIEKKQEGKRQEEEQQRQQEEKLNSCPSRYSLVRPQHNVSDEERAFWRAINTNTDDDTMWLVYADWLQEHDDEQAASLIRVGVANHQKHLRWMTRYSEAEEMCKQHVREMSRKLSEPHDPLNWSQYLVRWSFSPMSMDNEEIRRVATALAEVLINPNQAHPVWFAECVYGVWVNEFSNEKLASLTYDRIRALKLNLYQRNQED
jgi:uncharacterized protein (TIGR02996 family)